MSAIVAQLMVSHTFQFLMVATYPIALRRRDVKEEWIIRIDLQRNRNSIEFTDDRLVVRRRGTVGANHCRIQCNRCRTRMTLRNAALCERECHESATTPGTHYALCLIFIDSHHEHDNIQSENR